MMNSLIYKGYTARVQFDPRDDIFVGHVLGVRKALPFTAKQWQSYTLIFALPLDTILPTVWPPTENHRNLLPGRLMLRVPPEVHAAVVRAATSCNQSLNQWATSF